jgi:hypothetical protein
MSALGLQASKPLELLFQEDVVDVTQLKSILAKLTLPSEFRANVWKLLLGMKREKEG